MVQLSVMLFQEIFRLQLLIRYYTRYITVCVNLIHKCFYFEDYGTAWTDAARPSLDASLTHMGEETAPSDSERFAQFEVFTGRSGLRLISLPSLAMTHKFIHLNMRLKIARLQRYRTRVLLTQKKSLLNRVLLTRNFDKERSAEVLQELMDRKLHLWGFTTKPDGTLVANDVPEKEGHSDASTAVVQNICSADLACTSGYTGASYDIVF